jgi:hypothetical protein
LSGSRDLFPPCAVSEAASSRRARLPRATNFRRPVASVHSAAPAPAARAPVTVAVARWSNGSSTGPNRSLPPGRETQLAWERGLVYTSQLTGRGAELARNCFSQVGVGPATM